jgi:hypothetical protein
MAMQTNAYSNLETVNKAEHFSGEHGKSEMLGVTFLEKTGLVKAQSMEVTNDPRMFAKNVLVQRLGAFHVIAVAAVLMAKKSCGLMLGMETAHFNHPIQYVAFFSMACAFVMNLFCVLVITLQLFHVFRLITTGPTGFEIAKSYYLNANVVSLRHLAAMAFFTCLPTFVFASACQIWIKLGRFDGLPHSAPILIVFVIMVFVMFFTMRFMRTTFHQKQQLAVQHTEPLMLHLATVSHRSSTDPSYV